MKKIIKILLLKIMAFSCASSANWKEREKITAPFDGERFYNLQREKDGKNFWTFLKWKFSDGAGAQWPEWVESTQVNLSTVALKNLSYVLINHSTALIHMDGMNILTDPIWSERTSPVSFAGPKRVRKPAVAFEDLPKIDVVVVSHNHYDHMDLPTLKKLKEKFDPTFYVGLGNGSTLESIDIKKYVELDWWETVQNDQIQITMVPAQHWSARGLFDRHETLWGGYVIQGHKDSVYFAGDTGYGDFFKEIGGRFPKLTLSLIPIGAYEPRWFMKYQHINPEEAVLAHKDLGTLHSAGIHFGTFKLTNESIDQPLIDLDKALEKHNVSNFIKSEFGKVYNF